MKFGNVNIGGMSFGSTRIGGAKYGNITVYRSGGGPIPYDAELEYLESDGNSYINTGYTPSSEDGYEITFQAVRGNYLTPVGAFDASTNFSKAWGCNITENSAIGLRHLYGSSAYTTNRRDWLKKVTLTESGGTLTINGYTHSFTPSSFTAPVTAAIFAGHFETGNEFQSYGAMRFWGCKIWHNSQDNLVRDFIPVRVGQVGYLYDKITHQLFGNIGTGAFILGPDKNTLPYTSKVAYIQNNTFAEYIDTEVRPDNTFSMSADVDGVVGGSGAVIAARVAYANSCFSIVTNGSPYNDVRFDFGNKNGVNAASADGSRHVYELRKNVAYVDNTSVVTVTDNTFFCNYPLFLFAQNNGGTVSSLRNVISKIYAVKVYWGDILVRDFIPVRVGQVGCLYDQLNGVLYQNAGTGSFLYGADVN